MGKEEFIMSINKKEKIKEIRKLIFNIADQYDRYSPKGQQIIEFVNCITRIGTYELNKWQNNNRSRYKNSFKIIKDNIIYILYHFHQAIEHQPETEDEQETEAYQQAIKRLGYGVKRMRNLVKLGFDNTVIVGDDVRGYTLREGRQYDTTK